MNTKAKESRKLSWAKRRLQELGYYVVLSRASLGEFDLVAFNQVGIRMIQVKCNGWPDEAEEETLRLFSVRPPNSSKECWRFDDGSEAPFIRHY